MKKTEKKGSAGKSNEGSRSLQSAKGKGPSAEVSRPAPGAQPKRPEKKPPTHEQIAERAYRLWLQSGRPHGQDLICWLQAEAELKREAGK